MKATNIVVKTERTVEILLGIKRENRSKHNVIAKNNSNSINKPLPNECASASSWSREKQTLIDKIISLKSENQRYTLDLKKTQEKLEASIFNNKELEVKFNRNHETHIKQLNELQFELTQMNASYIKLKTNNEAKISELTRNRDLLEARTKQFQTVIAQQIDTKQVSSRKSSTESDEEEFEVERLLKDKLIEKRVYLVRWKSYDSTHDSWVEEANLNCPAILKKYKESKRK